MRRHFARLPVMLVLTLSMTGGFAGASENLLERPIDGPKRICLNYVAFDLKEGEQVVSFSAGTESAYLTVKSAGSSFNVGESQIYVQPRHRGKLVQRTGGASIYRGKKAKYLIYGQVDFLGAGERYLANISGEEANADLLKRFGMVGIDRTGCEQSFVYGWEYMVPDDGEASR